MGLSLTLITRLPSNWLKLYSKRCFSVSPISMANFTDLSLSQTFDALVRMDCASAAGSRNGISSSARNWRIES